jgi:hypothetical protein
MNSDTVQYGSSESTAFYFKKDRPVVIVAGGCDAAFEKELSRYFALLDYAFEGFSGYIISGGTTAGIPGMVGKLNNPHGDIVRVGYLPFDLPKPEERHPGYEFFRTSDCSDFTILDPLQAWADLLASGLDPKAVRVLGINGGMISAFEYRLGIISGAIVGIVENSGRSATLMGNDDLWAQKDNLVKLSAEPDSIREFIHSPDFS